MPFSNSPQYSTYKTIPIKFDGATFFRSGNITIQRDCQIVNMFFDRVSQENNKERATMLKKRPGITASIYPMNKSNVNTAVRGFFYDIDNNAMYWAVDSSVYVLTPDTSNTPVLKITLGTSTGQVGFCSYLKSDNTIYTVVSDGASLWLINIISGVATQVTDIDLPLPHQPFPLYLDGYLFLIKTGTSDIYNSDVDDPTSWTAGNFISAEISSDYALRMVKAKNYICVFGYNSIEYFYDAGNATGSPLSRNDSPFRGIGLVTGLSTIGDTTYFVGQDNQQNISVYTLNSFKVDRISNEIIDRTLQPIVSTSNQKSEVSLQRDGYSISVDGHNFYILTSAQTTWVYDIDEKFWYEWKSSSGVGLPIDAAWAQNNGQMYISTVGSANINILSPAIYQDFGSNFTTRYTMPTITCDTFHWKTAWRLAIFADQEGADASTSNLVVSWSNDDWLTTASSRNLDLFTENTYIRNLGRFRSRSFRFEYSDNFPLRLDSGELDINVGAH